MTTSPIPKLSQVIKELLDHAISTNWQGWDPFDGLNSQFFRSTGLQNSRVARLAWLQLFKRAPFNARRLLGVPPLRNPKALALFASGLLRRPSTHSEGDALAAQLLDLLHVAALARPAGIGWSYPFDWQSRAFFVNRTTPNTVCTVFCATAFLEAFHKWGESAYLEPVRGAAAFLLDEMHALHAGRPFFRYVPREDAAVHNVNLLAAAFLARAGNTLGDSDLVEIGHRAAQSSVRAQSPDGGWPYGTSGFHRFVDSFHTGYNLMALQQLLDATGDQEFVGCVERGYWFYDHNFRHPNGMINYFADRIYPLDPHAFAVAINLYTTFGHIDPKGLQKAGSVADFAVRRLRRTDGRFVYQRHRRWVNRISYLRWTDAWIFYALSSFLVEKERQAPDDAMPRAAPDGPHATRSEAGSGDCSTDVP